MRSCNFLSSAIVGHYHISMTTFVLSSLICSLLNCLQSISKCSTKSRQCYHGHSVLCAMHIGEAVVYDVWQITIGN